MEGNRSPKPQNVNKTATLSLPPTRDYFLLPSITRPLETDLVDSSGYKLPSLDFANSSQAAQASQYWPGATSSTSAASIPPSSTLPTPPTPGIDVFRTAGPNRETSHRMASAAVQQPGMASNLEPHGASSSFTARRSAASNLPSFELPPPPQLSHKFMPFSSMHNTQSTPAMVSVGNLLTPPSNIPGDNLSPTNGVNGATQGLPPYTPNGYWPPPATGGTPFGMGSGTTPQPWGQNSLNQLFPPRGMFSPSLGSLVRNSTNSPSASEGLPPPPYDLNHLPPFPASMSMSAPANLPTIAAQHQAMAYMNNAQTPVSASASQNSPVNADTFSQRPASTPSYYSGSQPSSTPQSSQFPAFHNGSPVQQSPMSATPQGQRLSPINGQPPNLQPAPSQQGNHFVRPYTYSLPAMSGPVMSNVHSPNGQMAMVGMPNGGVPGIIPGFNSGHSAQMQQMYGAPPQTPHNERPFKCDQCPQSFNRNHDLKRHKRIHLAVKPFPCGHCDKSFSRKDALKVGSLIPTIQVSFANVNSQRHILVKGCGKGGSTAKETQSMSPVDKSEVMSSDNDESVLSS